MNKPILCLDYDGTCTDYKSGWQGANVCNDSPVEGLFDFLSEAIQVFEIHIFSSRSHQPGGVDAMRAWFYKHYKNWQNKTGRMFQLDDVKFPSHKPPAQITIDDRAITFEGVWPDLEYLKNFKPWNKK
jgi:hypothetical protein